MLRKFAVAALLASLATGAMVASAMAQCASPFMICIGGDSFSYEDVYQTAPADSFDSHAGSHLTVVGKVASFGAPLDYLNANMATNEYTFVWSLTSLGTVKSAPLGQDGEDWDTPYTSGTFSIYEDPAKNAPGAATMPPNPPVAGVVPDRFVDGTLILTGAFNVFTTRVTMRSVPLPPGGRRFGGSWNANYHCTGGRAAEYGLVGSGVASAGALWCTTGASSLGQCGNPAGYSAHPSGKFDVPGSTPTSNSTWGRMKLLYR
jgi:hypothetical protein